MSAAERPIRAGVVGVGHLGWHHARLYASLAGVELVGVADLDRDRARGVAREATRARIEKRPMDRARARSAVPDPAPADSTAGGCCRAFDELSDLAAEVDVASVAVPTEAHREVAEALLAAGVDVLVEKPLARVPEEADAIIETARRHDRLVMVGHTERFNPAVIALTREVSRPRFFEIHRLAGFSARSTDIDVVMDLMIHDLDLLLHLDGSEPSSIDAIGVAALTDRVDIANARIRLASGCVANLTASRISAEPVRRIRVFQERTYLVCDTGRPPSLERYRLDATAAGGPRIQHDHLPIDEGEPLALELAAFVDAVRTRSAPPVDARQGRQAMELALRVRAAIEAGSAG